MIRRRIQVRAQAHLAFTLLAVAVAGLVPCATAQAAPAIEYYRLVPGFLPENKNASGVATGTGFATANPWGAYTAYLMATNARDQRTWRIENYLPMGNFTQGSTMYLFEGSQRALLVDTAQNTAEEMGKNDLKTVVRHLLGHNNDGSDRGHPVDFVVANTHSHGDHTGKNRQMSDRTVYYPDLDWPSSGAPANYVPIREGGGATTHGSGMAAGEIALGDRTIRAINLYGHTPGSMGYLDVENDMIATGDAIGSGLVWMHFGLISQYAETLRHLRSVLRPLDKPAILPAHFYQIASGARGKPPINGRPLDKPYVDDQLAAAEGVLNGTLVGEPYRTVGRNVAVVTVRSAGMTYSLNKLGPAGASGGAYHAIRISGQAGGAPMRTGMASIKSDFYLIRDGADNSLYLIRGPARALLVGTGAGTPGLAGFAGKLAGKVPVEVIVTSDDPGQIGGLGQFSRSQVYVPKGAGVTVAKRNHVAEVGAGDRISLGADSAGHEVTIEIEPLAGHSKTGLTLLDVSDRVLLSGDALGTQAADGGLILHDKLADFAAALAAWRARTDGKYDAVYTAHNFQWFTAPAFVDQLQNAVTRGLTGGEAAFTSSTAMPGYKLLALPVPRTSSPPSSAPTRAERRQPPGNSRWAGPPLYRRPLRRLRKVTATVGVPRLRGPGKAAQARHSGDLRSPPPPQPHIDGNDPFRDLRDLHLIGRPERAATLSGRRLNRIPEASDTTVPGRFILRASPEGRSLGGKADRRMPSLEQRKRDSERQPTILAERLRTRRSCKSQWERRDEVPDYDFGLQDASAGINLPTTVAGGLYPGRAFDSYCSDGDSGGPALARFITGPPRSSDYQMPFEGYMSNREKDSSSDESSLKNQLTNLLGQVRKPGDRATFILGFVTGLPLHYLLLREASLAVVSLYTGLAAVGVKTAIEAWMAKRAAEPEGKHTELA